MSPVLGPQAVQSVVPLLVQRSLYGPADQIPGQKIHEDVVESADRRHVQRKTLAGHPADQPGPATHAEKCLSKRA